MALVKTAKIDIGISEDNRQAVANKLNHLLADEFVLYTKTRKFHWNVKGIHFHDLHLFFESQYKELAEIMDEVAERIRKLGHYSLGTLQQFLNETNLLEHTDDGSSAEVMIVRDNPKAKPNLKEKLESAEHASKQNRPRRHKPRSRPSGPTSPRVDKQQARPAPRQPQL